LDAKNEKGVAAGASGNSRITDQLGGVIGDLVATKQTPRTQAQSARIDPLVVFFERADARAILFNAGLFETVPAAVDELWDYAVDHALDCRFGVDCLQALLAGVFNGRAP
jgi:hypothetical protein